MLYAEVSCKLNLPNRKVTTYSTDQNGCSIWDPRLTWSTHCLFPKTGFLLFYSNPKLKDNQGAKRLPPVDLGMFEENKLEMKKQMLSVKFQTCTVRN